MAKLVGFKSMLNRLARDTQFSMFDDKFKNGLIAEYKRKYKNYPRFKDLLSRRWKGYTPNQVAKFILDNHEDIFRDWFGKMFYFNLRRLEIVDPNTRSDVDFNAKFHYHYNEEEITFIEDLIKKYELKYAKPLIVMNQLIVTGLRLLAPHIETLFQRPYDFQAEEISDEETEQGTLVKVFFSSREA